LLPAFSFPPSPSRLLLPAFSFPPSPSRLLLPAFSSSFFHFTLSSFLPSDSLGQTVTFSGPFLPVLNWPPRPPLFMVTFIPAPTPPSPVVGREGSGPVSLRLSV